jgi:hypothetical protein
MLAKAPASALWTSGTESRRFSFAREGALSGVTSRLPWTILESLGPVAQRVEPEC